MVSGIIPRWIRISIVIGTALLLVLSGQAQSDPLSATGGISGRVTRAQNGAAINGATVRAIDMVFGFAVSSTTTNASGNYTITGLTPGQYAVRAEFGTLMPELYEGKDASGGISYADAIMVNASATTSGIDFALKRPVTIMGRVMNANGTLPLQDAGVAVFDSQGRFINSTLTDSAGEYAISGIFPQEIVVRASKEDYVIEYYNNRTYFQTPNALNPSEGSVVTGIDFTLDAAPIVRGTVTRMNGVTPVQFVLVSASHVLEPTSSYGVTTAADGTYRLPLQYGSGQYRVFTYHVDYAQRFYNNRLRQSQADLLTVTNGVTTSNINFRIPKYARVSGSVFEPNGVTPVTGAGLILYTLLNQTTLVPVYTANVTGNNFSFNQVDPGQVYLLLAGQGTRQVWYDRQLRPEGAVTEFELDEEEHRSGIMVRFTQPGSISGRVFAADGVTPLSGMTVQAYLNSPSYSYALLGEATSAADGSYTITVPGPGQYVVLAFGAGYAAETYNNHPGTYQTAGDLVTVTGGGNTPNINFSLASNSTSAYLTLNVTQQGTRPPKPSAAYEMLVRVVIKPTSGGPAVVNANYVAGVNGEIFIPGIPPGTYNIWVKGLNTLGAMSTHTLVVGSNTVTSALMRAGDTNGDNIVNLTDFTRFAPNFGKTVAWWNEFGYADFNGDGQVTITDFSLMATNFGATGTPAP